MNIIKLIQLTCIFLSLGILTTKAQPQPSYVANSLAVQSNQSQQYLIADKTGTPKLKTFTKKDLQWPYISSKASHKSKRVNFVAIALLIVCMATQVYFYRLLNKRNRQLRQFTNDLIQVNQNLHATNQKIIRNNQQLIRKKDTHFKAEQAKLNEQILQKNQQLVASTLHLLQKNQYLKELRKMINETQLQSNPKQMQKCLGKIANQINFGLRLEKDWDGFYSIFQQLNPNFYKDLQQQFPSLTKNDLRVCALIKLNLATREVAEILGIAEESVYMKCYRIRKKMALNDHQKLCEYLIAYESKPGLLITST
ncbi:MAG TPA: hypothetical protein DCS93_22365 [Microscillaceae bacterium]|nr:hypothetical protein [Microscillaceae bacterium]